MLINYRACELNLFENKYQGVKINKLSIKATKLEVKTKTIIFAFSSIENSEKKISPKITKKATKNLQAKSKK